MAKQPKSARFARPPSATYNAHPFLPRPLEIDDRWWRSQAADSRERAKEQDRAAQGRHNRELILADGTKPLASVVLYGPLPTTGTISAMLRFKTKRKTHNVYVGRFPVSRRRSSNLARAWGLVLDCSFQAKLKERIENLAS